MAKLKLDSNADSKGLDPMLKVTCLMPEESIKV